MVSFFSDVRSVYLLANERARRTMNQSPFEALWMDESGVVGPNLHPGYGHLLDDDLDARLKAEREDASEDPPSTTEHARSSEPDTERLRRLQSVFCRAERPYGRLPGERTLRHFAVRVRTRTFGGPAAPPIELPSSSNRCPAPATIDNRCSPPRRRTASRFNRGTTGSSPPTMSIVRADSIKASLGQVDASAARDDDRYHGWRDIVGAREGSHWLSDTLVASLAAGRCGRLVCIDGKSAPRTGVKGLGPDGLPPIDPDPRTFGPVDGVRRGRGSRSWTMDD